MSVPDDRGSSDDVAGPGLEPGELGPFDPPDDYPLEEEFEREPPRPLPAELNRGRHASRQRQAVSGLLMAAALCTASGLAPIVRHWGLYILPLQYLTWIGLVCGA